MTLFDEVVRDAAAAAARSAVVTVDEERVRHLAKSLHAPGPSPIGQRLPLRFASADDEMTFMALVSLLSFGASFRDRYRECLGQDMSPKEVAQRGVIGLFLAGKLDCDGLQNLALTDIETAFGLPLSREERLPNLPAYISVDSAVKPLARDILSSLHETARVLRCRDVPSLGAFIHREVLALARKSSTGTCAAADVVTLLASTFPGFNDVGFYSNAVGLVADLFWRFHDDVAEFRFPDIDAAVPRVDYDIVDVLFDNGVLSVREQPSAEHLRSASMLACLRLREAVAPNWPHPATNLDLDRALRDLQRDARAERPYSVAQSLFY
ncbi:unnamed protein product (mitochondrion) [Plasmodiophora brassicae]|uniref:Queuosine 5'-phosphate N-glycosylase/hydrolase n=1 Tax=Plasmodiophora brassicae TaxID=37360 RepID=A0A0G4IV24_PLABS|nr:hypothetical protein PBRA_001068 [Plasmodiophora brassicae]SPQ97178.1 unnamed protein product [Plasmodiophora brassicae]